MAVFLMLPYNLVSFLTYWSKVFWSSIMMFQSYLFWTLEKNTMRVLVWPYYLRKMKQKVYWLLKYWFFTCTNTFDWYLFQSIFCLNPYLSCSNSFVLSRHNRATTGTYSFVSLISNVLAAAAFNNNAVFWQVNAFFWQVYFTIDRSHFKNHPKITEIFQWYLCFNVFSVSSSRISSYYPCFEFELFRICYVIIWIIFIILSQTSWRFCSILMAVFYEVIDQYHNMQVFGIIYLRIVYFVYAVSKCFTVF